MSKPAQSFGEQAARFSLYSPLAVFLIGIVTAGNRKEPGVAIAVLSINVILFIAGFGFGIFALVSMRRYGRDRIFKRAVIGLILNGVAITVLAAATVPTLLAGRVKQQVVGHWELQSGPPGPAKQLQLTFNPDNTFTFQNYGGGNQTNVSLAGHWEFTHNRVIGITIERVDAGNQSAVGKKLGLGAVKSIDNQQMTLATDSGDEVYKRIP